MNSHRGYVLFVVFKRTRWFKSLNGLNCMCHADIVVAFFILHTWKKSPCGIVHHTLSGQICKLRSRIRVKVARRINFLVVTVSAPLSFLINHDALPGISILIIGFRLSVVIVVIVIKT